MKHKVKRSKAKPKNASHKVSLPDTPEEGYSDGRRRPTVGFADETSPKITHDEWQVKPFVGRLFSTEVPEFEEEETRPKPAEKQNKHTSNKKPPRKEQTQQRPLFSNVRHNEPEKINIDRECYSEAESVSSESFQRRRHQHRSTESWLGSPQIIKHRPTLSVKMDADYFVPKTHRRKEEKREKLLHKNHRPEQKMPVPEERMQLPMSVISESYQDRIYTPRLPTEELFRFGDIYEANMFHLIHKYLEVDTFHRVAYVGSEHCSLAQQVEEYFCLTNPIQSVFPGKVDYKDIKDKSKLLAFKIAHVGAEEFFAQAAKDDSYKSAPYDRIIIHDAVQYFNDVKVTLKNVMRTLHEFGKLLIIHRPGSLNTLPYFTDAKNRMADSDVPYMQIIGALQKQGADVEWDLVHVPIVMPTSKWLAMLKAKFPPQMEIMSNYEIACGLRELSEGPLKYLHGDTMEVEDRLMFITASHSTFDCAFPAVQRVGGASQVPYSGLAEIQYKLELTKEMEAFLPKPKASQYKMKSLF